MCKKREICEIFRQLRYTPVAPLGLIEFVLCAFYTPVAPLGL